MDETSEEEEEVKTISEEAKQHIEEQIGKPDYFECSTGHFAIQVELVSNVASGDMYYEYTPGHFALNINIVSNISCP